MKRLITGLSLIPIYFVGCNSSRDQGLHPVPEKLPDANKVDYAINLDSVSFRGLPALNVPKRLSVTGKIGSNEDPSKEFQRIKPFAFSDDYQQLYVLDFFEVEIFELSGTCYEPKRTLNLQLQKV